MPMMKNLWFLAIFLNRGRQTSINLIKKALSMHSNSSIPPNSGHSFPPSFRPPLAFLLRHAPEQHHTIDHKVPHKHQHSEREQDVQPGGHVVPLFVALGLNTPAVSVCKEVKSKTCEERECAAQHTLEKLRSAKKLTARQSTVIWTSTKHRTVIF